MILDKVLPFYTEEDKAILGELRSRVDELLERSRQIRLDQAEAGLDNRDPAAREYIERRSAILEQVEALMNNVDTVTARIEQRYIEAQAGNAAAILQDVRDILASISKTDIKDYMELLAERKASGDKFAKKPRFELCRFFILTKIRVQLSALAFWELPTEEAIELAETRTEDFYKKPKSAAIYPVEIPAADGKFFNVPSGPATNLINEVFIYGGNLADLPARKKKVNHAVKYEVKENGTSRRIMMKKGDTEQITIELPDIEKLSFNKAERMLFTLILIKANEQAVHDGEMTRSYVSFPLQELVDLGMYSSLRSARRGFNACMDVLTSLKIAGYVRPAKGKGGSSDDLLVIFIRSHVSNSQCVVKFNPEISWSFLYQYYILLPPYYFRLPSRASDLLFYIFSLARQNTKAIAERGYFTISFRAIQQRLQLPSEVDNREPAKTIRQPIEDALAAIEAEHRESNNNTDLQLTPVYDPSKGIVDFLDRGYLKVIVAGDFSAVYAGLQEKKQSKIDQSIKRRERITEQAQALRIAKASGNKDKAE